MKCKFDKKKDPMKCGDIHCLWGLHCEKDPEELRKNLEMGLRIDCNNCCLKKKCPLKRITE